MLVKIIVFNGILHSADYFLDSDFLTVDQNRLCFLFVGIFDKEYINSSILVYHYEFV